MRTSLSFNWHWDKMFSTIVSQFKKNTVHFKSVNVFSTINWNSLKSMNCWHPLKSLYCQKEICSLILFILDKIKQTNNANTFKFGMANFWRFTGYRTSLWRYLMWTWCMIFFCLWWLRIQLFRSFINSDFQEYLLTLTFKIWLDFC